MALREPGHVFNDRYEVVRFLGAGGFAAVYEARDKTINRPVAVKVLNLLALSIDPSGQEVFIKRFHREAQVAASIRNSNAVAIFDFGTTSDTQEPFLVMELLKGHDLEEELATNGPMAPPRAVSLLIGSLAALGEAHSMGVVHKDLKPANLFLTDPGTRREALKVVDFGIARIVDGSGTRGKFTGTGQILGTPQYLAPEYIESQSVTPSLDVYQMALILCEMITGRPVVDCDNPLKAVMVHSLGNLPIPDEVRAMPFWDVIEKALKTDPAERYSDADTFAEALLDRASAAAALGAAEGGADWRRTLAASSGGLMLKTPSSGPVGVSHSDTISQPMASPAAASQPMEAVPVARAHSLAEAQTVAAAAPVVSAPTPPRTRTPTVLDSAPTRQPAASPAPASSSETTAAPAPRPKAVTVVDVGAAPVEEEKKRRGVGGLLAVAAGVLLLLLVVAGVGVMSLMSSSTDSQETGTSASGPASGAVAATNDGAAKDDAAKDNAAKDDAATARNSARGADEGAEAKAGEGRDEGAADKGKGAAERAPSPAQARATIGRARRAAKGGRHKEALGMLRSMLADKALAGEVRLEALELMAFALLEAGDAVGDEAQRREDAVKVLQELLKLKPDYELPKKAPAAMAAVLDEARGESPEASPVEVSVVTNPRSARVFVDGKPLEAPATLRFESSEAEAVRITVRANGYESRTLKVKPSAGSVRVTLKKKPRSMSIVEDR